MSFSMKRYILVFLLLLVSASFVFSQDDLVMKAMRDELGRSMTQLHLPNLDKPYFITYRVEDVAATNISATLGQLVSSNSNRNRTLQVQVRVGDYKFDNTNFLTVRNFGPRWYNGIRSLPLDDDYDEIRRAIWLATDGQYKKAAEEIVAKRSILQHRQGSSDLPDLIKLPAVKVKESPAQMKLDVPALEKLARGLSEIFRNVPEILGSDVTVSIDNHYTRFISSEGTEFTRSEPVAMIVVRARTQAPDGQPLGDSFNVFGDSPADFNGDVLMSRTRGLIKRLQTLRTAKSLEHYNGPVLFEGEAAAEVVSQVLAPGMVAGRFPVTDEPQFESNMQQVMAQFGGSLADRIGGRVLPEWVDITDDPTQQRFNGVPLMGRSTIDDEGVPSRVVKLVEGGMLKALLAPRDPSQQAKESTGSVHGVGPSPSNFYFQAKKTQPLADMRKQLITMAKARGFDFGIVVRHVGESGLSFFMRMAGNAAGANAGSATEVYKLYADGHEELLRGAEIAPVPVSAFRDLLAAGDKPGVYNEPFIPLLSAILSGVGGGGGAPSVNVASYIVPPLLFEEVAVKQSTAPAPKPPVVPSPLAAGQ
jgi:predicted Zn-dependent protease